MIISSMLSFMPLKNFISYFLVLFSLFFFSLKIYLDKFFGVVDFEHFLIFVSFGLTGLLDSDDYIIIKFIQICIILPLVFIIGIVLVGVFAIGLAWSISTGLAGFWRGLPFWVIVIFCLCLLFIDSLKSIKK